MAHLSCVGADARGAGRDIDGIAAAGIENILALRGDPPAGRRVAGAASRGPALLHRADRADRRAPAGDQHRRRLLSGGAPGGADIAHDLRYLKQKTDSGASFLITQLFFDNELYFGFVEKARRSGIDVPILPGIMPITDASQIKTITGMCGASIPPALLEQLERRAGDAPAVTELGVSYATLQCAELLARGVPGIHFYTLNRSPATRAILSALKLLRPWERL